MKKLIVSAVAMLGFFAAGISAASADYCGDQAKHYANLKAAGTTVVGTGIGLLAGKVFGNSKKATIGAGIAGGVAGFAIGSAKWQDAYNRKYNECIGASNTKYIAVPAPGPTVVYAQCPNDPGYIVAPPTPQASVFQSLNVRTGPGKGCPAITSLPANTTVQVTQCSSTFGWCAIPLGNGQIGWSSQSYLHFF